MNIEQTIKTAVRQAIMEEINGLAIRATIREKIEAAGVTDADIRELVKQTDEIRKALNEAAAQEIKNGFDISVVINPKR